MTKFRQISHVIFDMDGVLLDTEPLYTKAIQNVVGKYGKTFTWEIKARMMGAHRIEGAKFIVKELDLPLTWEEYDALIEEEYKITFDDTELIHGAKKFVQHLSKNKVPMAVATSSSHDSFNIKTAKHKEFFKLFEHIVCGGSDPDVKQGKPNPEIFLVAASRFQNKPAPEKCLVLEDAPNGVQAGIRAGMQVVMIPDKHIPEELRKEATLVTTAMDKIPLEKFGLPPIE